MVTILEFPIGTILVTFNQQVTSMLPTKFQVNWPLGLGEEAKRTVFKMAAILDFKLERF